MQTDRMSAANGSGDDDGVVRLKSTKRLFEIDDTRFELNILETAHKINELAKTHAEATNYEHLDGLAAWVAEQTGGIKLTRSQANELWEYIQLETVKSKRVFLDTLKSLTTTV